MNLPLPTHEQPGSLVAICGMDGSGKTTLEEALVAAIEPVRTCRALAAPSEWWRQDAHVRRSLWNLGDGQDLPNLALLHFNLADCYAHQSHAILPALASGAVVVANRYLYDMLALFEARGLELPGWLGGAVAGIMRPDLCFVLEGSAEVIVERVVRRDGPMPGRFDQDVAFVERYNASLRRMAEENGLTLLPVEADLAENVDRCLGLLREANTKGVAADR